MYIKHLIGSRKGEIEDVAFEGARAKVLAGQAEDVYNQLHRENVVVLDLGQEKIVVPEGGIKIEPQVMSTRIDDVEMVGGRKKRK